MSDSPPDTPPGSPLVGVLALQGDVREHLAALSRAGARALAVRRPEELAAVDGIVLPGGESTTMDKLARGFGLMEPLRERIRGGLPAYGSCAGLILLADRLVDGIDGQETIGGLDVLVRRNAFGRQVDSFEGPIPIPAIGEPAAHGVFIRAPWVEEAGAGVEVLGRVGGGPAAGRIVAVRQGALLATAFHPELTGDDRIHGLFVRMVRTVAGAVDDSATQTSRGPSATGSPEDTSENTPGKSAENVPDTRKVGTRS